MVLSQAVKRMMGSVAPVLGYALDAGAAELPVQAEGCSGLPRQRLTTVESVLDHRVQHLRPLMDPRVLRRAAKDLWNSCAGVSHCNNEHISAYLLLQASNHGRESTVPFEIYCCQCWHRSLHGR